MGKASTWTDWLGIWHASVPLSGSRHKDAMTARKAIREEFADRGLSRVYYIKFSLERTTY